MHSRPCTYSRTLTCFPAQEVSAWESRPSQQPLFNSYSLKIGLGLGLEDDEDMICSDKKEEMHIVV